jgi:hypothetical protein
MVWKITGCNSHIRISSAVLQPAIVGEPLKMNFSVHKNSLRQLSMVSRNFWTPPASGRWLKRINLAAKGHINFILTAEPTARTNVRFRG